MNIVRLKNNFWLIIRNLIMSKMYFVLSVFYCMQFSSKQLTIDV